MAETLVQEVVKSLRTKGVVSTLVDGEKFGEFRDELGFNEGELGLAILDYENERHYLFGDRPKTAAEVEAFIQDFLDGKLAAHMKSQEAPVENNGPVKIVVGTTFEEIVLDTSKDVLLEFYAPWCGHCQKLAPVYAKVGKYLAGIPDIVVASMDVSANDPPQNDQFKVEGIPTIKLVKKDGSVVDLDESRSLREILTFVATHATTPFSVPEIVPEDENEVDDEEADEDFDFADMFDGMDFDPSLLKDLEDLDGFEESPAENIAQEALGHDEL